MVDGVVLNSADIKKLLAQTEGLAYLKGKWVEVDHNKLKALLEQLKDHEGEIALMEALRIELGTGQQAADVGPLITNGKWLGELLQNLRQPQKI